VIVHEGIEVAPEVVVGGEQTDVEVACRLEEREDFAPVGIRQMRIMAEQFGGPGP
jgi:hypothetical protein